MPNIVKNALFLLFFCSFAGGVFYVSTSSDVLHLSEKIFLGEIGFSKETKTQILTGDFSITLENNEVGEEEILGQKANPQSADLTAPVCTASYDPTAWTSGSVVVTLTCSEEVEFCTMDDYSDCPQPQPVPAEEGVPCWRAEDIAYNGFTIMACNLGATEVGNGEASYGNYYQRGNNYPMGDGKLTGEYLPNSTTRVNASSFGPNNPFSNATFIKQSYWDSSMNNNLRGGSGDTLSTNGAGTREDRQGPCPEGYHVPSTLEWSLLFAGVPNSPVGVNIIQNTLFLPAAGQRNYSNARLISGSIAGSYHSSSPYLTSTQHNYALYFTRSGLKPQAYRYRGRGLSVRCFLNAYDPPDPIPCDGAPDITYNGITIMACNLGATEVGNGENSYGYYYQRGNNYPMGDYTIATYTPYTSTKIDASAFGPNNPYSSATFIRQNQWDNSNNKNLRGGSGDTLTGNGPGTREDRQGPCPDGYHIPSILERQQLLSGVTEHDFKYILFLPLAGFRNSNATLTKVGAGGSYHSSSPYPSTSQSYDMYYNTSANAKSYQSRGVAQSIRCFQDS